MPTYEYECTECGHCFEVFQSITAEPVKKCPKCNGYVRKLIGTGVGIIFKGSGFYSTDYKRAGADKLNNNKNGSQHSSKSNGNREQTSKSNESSKNKESKNQKKSNNNE